VARDMTLSPKSRKAVRPIRAAVAVLFLVGAVALSACASAQTHGATNVTATSATLSAKASWDQGEDVAYWFETRSGGGTVQQFGYE
jgi:hypothetical protein